MTDKRRLGRYSRPMWYADLKDILEHYIGLERDALHIHAALLLYVLAMAIFRRTRRSRFPWLLVLAVELANEAYDMRVNFARHGGPMLAESAKDLWNTMLWPTVLLLVGRYTTWFQRRVPAADMPEAPGGSEALDTTAP